MNTSDVPPYSRRSQFLVLFPQRSPFRPVACFDHVKECICNVCYFLVGVDDRQRANAQNLSLNLREGFPKKKLLYAQIFINVFLVVTISSKMPII